MIRFAWTALPALLLCGCMGPFFDHVKIDPTSLANLRTQYPAYTAADLEGREYSVLQPLRAVSCKNKFWDATPTAGDATDQLRVKAAELGANGLLGVTCEAPTGTSLVKNCWSSLTCHAAAVRVGPASDSQAAAKASTAE